MKKVLLFFAVAAMATIQGCEGPEGPQGPTGYSAESEVFEVNPSFTAANNFSQTYSLQPTILNSDNILVYELYDVQDGIDTWALLPQVYYFPEGTAQYNYNFSYDQFTLLIDASFDRTLLPSTFTLNKIFRVVIVPGYFSKQNLNVRDYNSVITALNLQHKPVRRIN